MSRDFFAPVSNPRLRIPTSVPPGHASGTGHRLLWPVNVSRNTPADRRQNPIVCPTVAPRVPIPRREKQTVLTLKYLFEIAGLALLAAAAAILLQDLQRLYQQPTLILNNHPRPDPVRPRWRPAGRIAAVALGVLLAGLSIQVVRSEEHTSELQSLRHLVC